MQMYNKDNTIIGRIINPKKAWDWILFSADLE
jgi:hypothetical protein